MKKALLIACVSCAMAVAGGPGRIRYILMCSRGNSACAEEVRKTAALAAKFRNRVNFVTIDLDEPRPPELQRLVRDYYQGFTPHVTVLAPDGSLLHDAAGPADRGEMTRLLNERLKK